MYDPVWQDSDTEVHKDYLVLESVRSPFQFAVVVDIAKEGVPRFGVVVLNKPDTNYVIDVLLEVQKFSSVFTEENFKFKQTDVHVGIVHRSACTHGTARALTPVGISKLYYVVAHNFGESFGEEFPWDFCWEALGKRLQVILDHRDTVIGINIGVHADGIQGEQSCIGW